MHPGVLTHETFQPIYLRVQYLILYGMINKTVLKGISKVLFRPNCDTDTRVVAPEITLQVSL
jgi:hypothetical protein